MRLHELIWLNKYIFVAYGLWPMRPDAELARQRLANLRFFVGLSAVICLIVPEFMTVAAHWGDIDILGDVGSLIVIQSQLTFKILYCFLHRRRFRSVYQQLKDFRWISDDPGECEHFEQLVKMAKLANTVFTLMAFSNMLSFEAIPFFTWLKNRREINEDKSTKDQSFTVWLYSYPFDTQRTPNYELVFILQSLDTVYVISMVASFDSIVMIFIVHVSGQFRLIASRFRTIGWKISNQTTVKDNYELRAEIDKLVAQHQRTIKVAKELSTLLSPMMFGQIMSSALEICLSGYVLIEGDGSAVKIVKFSMFFVSLLMELIFLCTPAELLIQESTTIADTIYYEVPWSKLPPSLRRDLGFVMMRAQKACRVSALHQVMSIRRITEVVNAAGSYLALLRSMRK